MIPRIAALLLWIGGLAVSAPAQPIDFAFLRTQAEISDFTRTTPYDEVMAFVEIAAHGSDPLHLTTFGYTMEGRALPLVVYGDVDRADPASVKASGKTRVYIQGNIHAGEVCGKEALLMLVRALAAGQHATWADSLVLLIAPIYNADGNERVSLTNRPRQNGPLGGMGQRPNAQGLDLNRDHMKLDSPEARSLVRMVAAYDPHVLIDLHTTNGTYHGYHLTYSPPLHPSTPASIVSLLREDWLPEVTRRIRTQYDWEYYYYGNLPYRESDERGWYTFDHRPRFSNNYAGLRNRFGILSEAYAYAPFKERVLASLYFVEEILDYAASNARRIQAITQQADAASYVGAEHALTATFKRSEEPVDILMGEVEMRRHPYTGEPILHRLDVREPESMYEYGQFQAVETTRAPEAYYVPPDLGDIIERLEAHGIQYEALPDERTLPVERFRIDSTHVAERDYQGRHAVTLSGTYEAAQVTLPAGTMRVPVAQPLGRLVVALLEPRSDDGFQSWGLIEAAPSYYPIVRAPAR